MFGLPYLKAHRFNHLQNRIWRPGEAYTHSGGTYQHREGSDIILLGSDLRTNPFKGGGDGVILNGPNMINSPSRNEEEQPSPLGSKEDGLDVGFDKLELKQQEAHGWTQREREATAHKLAIAQGGEATRFWQGPVSGLRDKAQQGAKQHQAQTLEEKEKRWLQESKPKKRPFHIWCWTCTRKRQSCGLVRKMRPWRSQGQPKPKCSRKHLWPKKKRTRVYGKTHGSDGSKEESKAREARPPDGPGLNQFVEEEEKRPMARPKMFYSFMFSYFVIKLRENQIQLELGVVNQFQLVLGLVKPYWFRIRVSRLGFLFSKALK